MNDNNYVHQYNYDKYKLPSIPSFLENIILAQNYDPLTQKNIKTIINNLIYIGQGTNPSIAYTYNNGRPYIGSYISASPSGFVSTALEQYLYGNEPTHYHFLSSTSPLLPKIFPLTADIDPTHYTKTISHIQKLLAQFPNHKQEILNDIITYSKTQLSTFHIDDKIDDILL